MVLPFTFHRYCLWHILNKFSEKINVMVHNDEYHMLVNIIKHSESPEFEERWAGLMENRDFADNEWLCSMYAIHSQWVPAYANHIFSAGMSSSQRSNANTETRDEDENIGTQFDGRDDGTFTSQASSHYDVVNWFL
ncbi:Protein FAR1-RELATED SEQUENCE 5 [Abeliophyllum distichum]|uniref:Protein FAR1-RELATED SEQUENCE n=1 Tax=Abeliophyllum distichum TaxID=126358 RepID=A0ABD1SD03_9LAMI